MTQKSASIYYMTSRNSATGKKLAAIEVKKKEAIVALKNLLKKYDYIKEIQQGYWRVWGGVSAIRFKDGYVVDRKLWKKADATEGYIPRKGHPLEVEIGALPSVLIEDLNKCIGFKEDMFKTIGVSFGKKKIGVEIAFDWGIKMPKDCKEVTFSEYHNTNF